jgi:hypothetical protein
MMISKRKKIGCELGNAIIGNGVNDFDVYVHNILLYDSE